MMADDHRSRLISECVTAAQSVMDTISTAIAWSPGQDTEVEVEIFSGTRIAERITAGERDQRARETLAEIRNRFGKLLNLYPSGQGVGVRLGTVLGEGEP